MNNLTDAERAGKRSYIDDIPHFFDVIHLAKCPVIFFDWITGSSGSHLVYQKQNSQPEGGNMQNKLTTEKIIGCAYKVYNTMGFGFLESVYEKCLLIELKNAGMEAVAQKSITVKYEGEVVGDFIADILVENSIILELKSVRRLVRAHEVQLVNYLVATGKDVGLLLNFTEDKVEVKRKVRSLKKADEQDV